MRDEEGGRRVVDREAVAEGGERKEAKWICTDERRK
jgi:hypothetical protein